MRLANARLLRAATILGLTFAITAVFDRVAVRSQTSQAKSSIDPDIIKGLSWRSIGPLRGGRSLAISGVKGRPREGYFGTTGGGLTAEQLGSR